MGIIKGDALFLVKPFKMSDLLFRLTCPILVGLLDMVANLTKQNVKRPIPPQLVRHAWKAGQAGGGIGKPVGMAGYIRSRSLDGRKLADFFFSVLDGKITIDGASPKFQDRIRAGEWLADRGFGRAIETTLELSGTEEGEELAKKIARELALRNLSIDVSVVDGLPSSQDAQGEVFQSPSSSDIHHVPQLHPVQS